MGIQMRLSANDERFYSPDRDLAYCSPHLVHRAMLGLNPENQEHWIRAFIEENNIPPEQLVEAARALADYMNKALTDPQYKQPFEALQAVGFFNLDPKTSCIVCAKLGQVFLSAIFSSIRDVTRDPKAPPFNTKEIADAAEKLQEDVRKFRTMPRWRIRLKRTVRWIREKLGF